MITLWLTSIKIADSGSASNDPTLTQQCNGNIYMNQLPSCCFISISFLSTSHFSISGLNAKIGGLFTLRTAN